ncbi:MAG: DUF4833 domain-containing protein [Elusimicrobiota bacterium]|nr:DUF4833 domain-containing protein [Elusimicrobiota bacterium]
MKKIILFAVVLFVFAVLSDAASVNLFKIERNKNANVVMYDIVLNDDGTVNEANPIDSYWLLLARDGRREEVASFEKRAYGYTIVKKGADYILTLKAVKDRDIKIMIVGGKPKGEIMINDKPAYLNKVYVFATNGIIPSVQYYTLTGTDIQTAAEVSEKIEVK